MKLTKKCPVCGKMHEMTLTDEETKAYYAYARGEGLLQDCFPNLYPYEREFIKLGYCPKCQERLFVAKPYTGERIKEVQ